MTANGWLQILFFCARVLARREAARALSRARSTTDRFRWLAPVERAIYRVCGVDPERGPALDALRRRRCCCSALATMLLTYVVLRLQHVLPLNPQHLAAVPDRQAFETAASFTTNTNWQSYGGESTMSYFSQMTQLAFHNFVSAAVGMAVAVALVRGIARRVSRDASATSGSISCAARSTCCCRSRSCSRSAVRAAGRDPELQAVPRRSRRSRARSRRIAMGPVASQEVDQAARHERRRLLQRELRASVREPDAVDQLLVDVHDLHRSRPGSTYMLGRMVRNVSGMAGRCGRRCSCSSSAA